MSDVKMATVRAASRLAGPGRAICEVRGHHYILDAPPLIEGPNEEVNPVEAMIAPLAACAVLFLEYLSRTMGVPLEEIRAEAEGDFDPRGVKGEGGEGADAALAALRLTYRVTPAAGADRAGVDRLIEAFRARCPVHRTLSKAVDIAEEVVWD
ncbi:MAG: OsmC family protein [Nitrospinota bacterium]